MKKTTGTTFRDVWEYAQIIVDIPNRKVRIKQVRIEYP